MKEKMTKEEYVASRRTKFDEVLFYSWIPFMIVFCLIGVAVANDQMEGAKQLSLVSVLCLVLTIVCRGVILANKEKKYIEDWYEYLEQ